MVEARPSVTAWKVALRRAAHQLLDVPCVFEDPVALRIIGEGQATLLRANPGAHEDSPIAPYLRAFMAVRSRCAEDHLRAAVARGVGQYVILGAGLDTFAYRNPHPAGTLRVFEVDHPATQAWKRQCLAEAEIELPAELVFAPVDFEAQTLEAGLLAAGYDAGAPTFFSWLGVTPYLSFSAIEGTLRFVAARPVGSEVVFDYGISPALLGPRERHVFEALAARVASVGEPFQTFFEPAELVRSLLEMGFRIAEDLPPERLNAQYLQGRTDGLRVGSVGHIMTAQV